MFFIGGVFPKLKPIGGGAIRCPRCPAEIKQWRRDHLLSIFFIPIYTVSKGTPFWRCESCGYVERPGVAPHRLLETRIEMPDKQMTCPGCGDMVRYTWKYCAGCGTKLQ